MRSALLAAPASLIVMGAALGAGWAVSSGAEDRAAVVSALDALPATTGTVDFTRWTDIDGPLDDAGLRGLTTRSVVAVLDTEMRAVLGWSATDLEWESYGRLDDGAVTALGLGDVTVRRAEKSFAAIGSPVDERTWHLDAVDAGVSSDFLSTFAWVRVVPDRELVLGAADRVSLERATAAIEGREPSLLDVRSVAGLAGRLGGATSVLLQDDRFLCTSSAIGADDQAARRQLAAALGPDDRLADPVWGARGLVEGEPQRLVFAAAFGSDDVAREQGRIRQTLTEGPFIGRSGQVAESLRDVRTDVGDGVVSFDFTLTPQGEQFMTDTGPVVFAGCAPR